MSNNTNANITAVEADAIIEEGTELFGYVVDKDPTPKQSFYAATVSALTGIEVTPKQYQAMILTHRFIQASDLNRARADYRPRSAESVIKASNTLLENASSMVLDDQGALISKSATHIPEDIFAPGELARLAEEAQAYSESGPEVEEDEDEISAEELVEDEAVEEAPAEELFASVPLESLTKAELIEEIVQAEVEVNQDGLSDDELAIWADRREHELKRNNKATLVAFAEEKIALLS